MHTLKDYFVSKQGSEHDFNHIVLACDSLHFYVIVAVYVSEVHVSSAVTRFMGFTQAADLYESYRL